VSRVYEVKYTRRRFLGRAAINTAGIYLTPNMDPRSENQLIGVAFDPPESESPPQTPRRLRPAPQQRESSAVVTHKIQVEDEERKFAHETTWRSCCLTVDKRALLYFGQMGSAF